MLPPRVSLNKGEYHCPFCGGTGMKIMIGALKAMTDAELNDPDNEDYYATCDDCGGAGKFKDGEN